MNTARKYLSCYSDVIRNLDNLCGLIPDSRIREAKLWISDDAFIEPRLEGGKAIQNYKLNRFDNFMYHSNQFEHDHSREHLNKLVLENFFTDEEIDIINNRTDRRYRENKEKIRFDKAEKIEAKDYSGWVYYEGVGYNDGYFESVDELLEHLEDSEPPEDDDAPRPKYVWACNEHKVVDWDLNYVLERCVSDETWDGFDARYDLNGIKELKAAIEEFSNINSNVKSYSPNFKLAVLL